MTRDDLEDLWRLTTAWLTRPSALGRDVRNGKNGLQRLRELIVRVQSEWVTLLELSEKVHSLSECKSVLEEGNSKLEKNLRETGDKLALQAKLEAMQQQFEQAQEQLQSLQSTIGSLAVDQPKVVVHEVERPVIVSQVEKDPRVPILEAQLAAVQAEAAQLRKSNEALEARCAFFEQEILTMGATYGAR